MILETKALLASGPNNSDLNSHFHFQKKWQTIKRVEILENNYFVKKLF